MKQNSQKKLFKNKNPGFQIQPKKFKNKNPGFKFPDPNLKGFFFKQYPGTQNGSVNIAALTIQKPTMWNPELP